MPYFSIFATALVTAAFVTDEPSREAHRGLMITLLIRLVIDILFMVFKRQVAALFRKVRSALTGALEAIHGFSAEIHALVGSLLAEHSTAIAYITQNVPTWLVVAGSAATSELWAHMVLLRIRALFEDNAFTI